MEVFFLNICHFSSYDWYSQAYPALFSFIFIHEGDTPARAVTHLAVVSLLNCSLIGPLQRLITLTNGSLPTARLQRCLAGWDLLDCSLAIRCQIVSLRHRYTDENIKSNIQWIAQSSSLCLMSIKKRTINYQKKSCATLLRKPLEIDIFIHLIRKSLFTWKSSTTTSTQGTLTSFFHCFQPQL